MVTREVDAGAPVARTNKRRAHPLAVRLCHWIGAAALLCMIGSGWQIYNASPLLPFLFPPWATLGGWLAAGVAWHLTAMWVLVADGIVYLAWGFASGHLRREIRPRGPRAALRDLGLALRFRLPHAPGHYNAVQRLLYASVLLAAVLIVLSGLSIWKPVQLGWLTWCFGGYDVARVIHFSLMSAIVLFIVVHLALVAFYPRTLPTMITGGTRAPDGERA